MYGSLRQRRGRGHGDVRQLPRLAAHGVHDGPRGRNP